MYKVTVRQGLGSGDWKTFSKVIFEVSLDNKRYRGDSFYSILSWAKPRFESIEIIVCDLLQRHNLVFSKQINMESASHEAKKMGDDWIRDSSPLFKELGLSPTITRWEEWLAYNPPYYERCLKDLKDLYKDNPNVKQEIEAFFNAVWDRNQKHEKCSASLRNTFKDEVFLPYLFEETALSAVFLPALSGISAYPGSLPKFWNNFIEGSVDILKGFGGQTFITLDLKRQ